MSSFYENLFESLLIYDRLCEYIFLSLYENKQAYDYQLFYSFKVSKQPSMTQNKITVNKNVTIIQCQILTQTLTLIQCQILTLTLILVQLL